MSSAEDEHLPAVNLSIEIGRNFLWVNSIKIFWGNINFIKAKTKAALKYIHKNVDIVRNSTKK
jgi:hypothetical protein